MMPSLLAPSLELLLLWVCLHCHCWCWCVCAVVVGIGGIVSSDAIILAPSLAPALARVPSLVVQLLGACAIIMGTGTIVGGVIGIVAGTIIGGFGTSAGTIVGGFIGVYCAGTIAVIVVGSGFVIVAAIIVGAVVVGVIGAVIGIGTIILGACTIVRLGK